MGGFNGLGLRWARKLTDMRRNPPKWLTDKCDAEMKNTKFAKSEVGFDESKGDQFIPSELMQGGVYNPKQNDRSGQGPRGIKYVSVGTEVAMNFRCDDYPPESPPKLVVVGMAFKAGLLPDMEIEVNGKSVWRGKAFEVPYCFKPLEVVLPVSVLQRTNRLVLRNMSPTEEAERKSLIHYVVVKK